MSPEIKVTKEHIKTLKSVFKNVHKGFSIHHGAGESYIQINTQNDYNFYQKIVINNVCNDKDYTNCFHSVDKDLMYPIVSMLREGDVLQITWWKNGGKSEITEQNNLCSDYVYLTIKRKYYNRDSKYFKFLLHRSVTYDNSARMIK